tara:strand:- start:88470 stop:88673 length:204 start_codon:yes stop_codon:yes gene_type:complete
MNKSIKMILMLVGLVLVAYGVYTLVQPEVALDIGILKVEEQDNTNAYTTIAFGIVALAIGYLGGRKS